MLAYRETLPIQSRRSLLVERPGVTSPVQTLLQFGLSFLRPMAYDYLSWRDPLPAVRATTTFTRDTVRGLAVRMRRNGS